MTSKKFKLSLNELQPMLRESTTNLDINDLFLIATRLNNELNCVNDFSYKKSASILILKEFEQNVKISIQK